MKILDGKKLSQKILTNLTKEIAGLKQKPTLDIVLVGSNPGSLKYVELKQARAAETGISVRIHHLDQASSTDDVLSLVRKLNNDNHVSAYMVQLPLPPQIDTDKILLNINPNKDADGLSPINLALLFQKSNKGIASATSFGIMKLLQEYKITLSGKHSVIIGRSPDVSLPLFAQLLAKNCTVTICHSHTQDLAKITKEADILISATGIPNFLDKNYLKKGVIAIDVGYGLDPNTKRVSGDFYFDEVKDLVSFISPVPGGVGPMTVASLLFNTVTISKKSSGKAPN